MAGKNENLSLYRSQVPFLTREEIFGWMNEGKLFISPDPALLSHMDSFKINLHLSGNIKHIKANKSYKYMGSPDPNPDGTVFSVLVEKTGYHHDHHIDDEYEYEDANPYNHDTITLFPGEYYIASTAEEFITLNNIIQVVERRELCTKGLMIHHGGFMAPMYHGKYEFGITVPFMTKIYPGMNILDAMVIPVDDKQYFNHYLGQYHDPDADKVVCK